MPKHTKEPWVIDETAPRDILRGDQHGTLLATAYFDLRPGDISEEEALANARLMVAAPGLLEACRFVLEHIADPARTRRDLYPAFGLNSGRALEMLSAAIEKAEVPHA